MNTEICIFFQCKFLFNRSPHQANTDSLVPSLISAPLSSDVLVKEKLAWTVSFPFPSHPFPTSFPPLINPTLPSSLPYQTPQPPPTSLTPSSRDFITKFKFGGFNRPFLSSYIFFPLFTFPSAPFLFFSFCFFPGFLAIFIACHRKTMLYGQYIENRIILNDRNIDLIFFFIVVVES